VREWEWYCGGEKLQIRGGDSDAVRASGFHSRLAFIKNEFRGETDVEVEHVCFGIDVVLREEGGKRGRELVLPSLLPFRGDAVTWRGRQASRDIVIRDKERYRVV
jgi:hypothetical protein